MNDKTKKRNHYIPKTYLKRFLNDQDTLYVYKKGEKFFSDGITKDSRLLTVVGEDGLNRVAVKKDLYIPSGEFGEDKNIFEDFFCDEIESKYDIFISDLEDSDITCEQNIKKYHEYVINLLSSMYARTLHSKRELEEMYESNIQMHHKLQTINKNRNDKRIESLKEVIRKRHPEYSKQKVGESIKEYFKMIEAGEFKINFPRNKFIKEMFGKMQMFAQIISDMNIQIIKNNTSFPFITSDAPVVYFVPKEKVNFYFGPKSLGGPYTELYLPLTKNICLLLTRRNLDSLDYVYVTQGSWARVINYNIAHNSRDFIFSPETNVFLDKFIDEYIPYPFKFTIS